VLVNNIDLLPYIDFSLDKVKEDIARINPSATVFMVSGRTGEGIEAWIEWLLEEVKRKNLKL
jgi:hydrogenase nickel incorporation protein HypB